MLVNSHRAASMLRPTLARQATSLPQQQCRSINLAVPRTTERMPPSLLSLAQLSPKQIASIITQSSEMKLAHRLANPKHGLDPSTSPAQGKAHGGHIYEQTLRDRSIAVMFSKRSTRTRVACETAINALGGHAFFLSPQDIQLGVNESLYDTSKIISSMADGIIARVDGHEEVELLAKTSDVPVLNALSQRYHPTQILADLLAMSEDELLSVKMAGLKQSTWDKDENLALGVLGPLQGLKVAWVGDSNNILADMLVSFARLGINLSVAVPRGYERDEIVWGEMQDGLRESTSWTKGEVKWCNDPKEALQDADVVVTDTWISMGDEASKEQRLRDFKGFQVTEELCRGVAKPDWKFMHCLPRKSNEVDDEVFYGPRSIVFPEGENRRWTIQALVDRIFGKWLL